MIAILSQMMGKSTSSFSLLSLAPSAWYDFSDDSLLTHTSNATSQANDKSGNGRHVTASGSAQPTRTVAGQNSRNVLLFDGSDDILSNTSAGCSGATSITFLMVAKWVSGGSNEDIAIALSQAAQQNLGRHWYRTVSGGSMGFATWANDLSSSAIGLDIGGGYHVFSVAQLGTTVQLGCDGVYDTRTLPSAPGAVNMNTLSLGGIVGSSGYFTNILMGEVFMKYSNLSQSDLQKAEGKLAWGWGLQGNLAAGHPHKNSAP